MNSVIFVSLNAKAGAEIVVVVAAVVVVVAAAALVDFFIYCVLIDLPKSHCECIASY